VAALTPSGGPGRRFKLTWQGATVTRQVDAAVQRALDGRAQAALDALRSELHRDTGEMAERAFAEVSVAGTKRTLRLGSDAPHTAYHELGTSNYPAHPQIRAIADRIAPTITPAIRTALGGR
jgi:hypothetical protein